MVSPQKRLAEKARVRAVQSEIRSQVQALRHARQHPYAVVLGATERLRVALQIDAGGMLPIVDPDRSTEQVSIMLYLKVERSEVEREIRVRALGDR
jgi:hypothetical protein